MSMTDSTLTSLEAELIELKLENSRLKELEKSQKEQAEEFEKLRAELAEKTRRIEELSDQHDQLTVSNFLTKVELTRCRKELNDRRGQEEVLQVTVALREHQLRQATVRVVEVDARVEREVEKAEHYKKKVLLLEEKLEKMKVEGGVEQVEVKKEQKDVGEPKCEICLRGYSAECPDLVPRILDCGHTLCEECAGKLVQGSQIACPFDRLQTILTARGVVGLAKNYAIIAMVERKD